MCERYNKAIDSLRQLVSTFQFLYQNLTCKRTFHVGCRTLCWNAPYVVFGRTLVHTLNITRSCFSMTHTGSLGLGSLSFVHRFWVLIVDRLQYSAQRKGCGGGGGGLIVDRLQSSAQRKGWVGGGGRGLWPLTKDTKTSGLSKGNLGETVELQVFCSQLKQEKNSTSWSQVRLNINLEGTLETSDQKTTREHEYETGLNNLRSK